MKKILYPSLSLACLIILAAFFAHCSKGSDPTPTPSAQDQAKTMLTSGTWKLQSLKVDGVDQTLSFKNFTINFSSGGFTATNGGAVWPASGTWSFQGTSTTTIIRGDGLAVDMQISSNSLVMTLTSTATTFGPGRNSSIKGQNVFSMTK